MVWFAVVWLLLLTGVVVGMLFKMRQQEDWMTNISIQLIDLKMEKAEKKEEQ